MQGEGRVTAIEGASVRLCGSVRVIEIEKWWQLNY